MKTLMIYGATGYTGQLASSRAKDLGLHPIIAGRDEKKLSELAFTLDLPYRTFALDNSDAVNHALANVDVLLNCAGPFMRTAEPLMKGAIRTGTHYLDVAAELDSYHLAEALDEDARNAGVMLMPGGSVAMLGSLTAHAIKRVAKPYKVYIALHVTDSMSRGSAISATENLTLECLVRANGELISKQQINDRFFDFGNGKVTCFPVTLPDLITIWRATKIPNIETFVHVSGDAFPTGDLSLLPEGPTAEQRDGNRYQAAVTVVGQDGESVHSVLDTVNGYSFTPLAAAEAARRVLKDDFRPGFQVPADQFGAGFAETIADTQITDL